MSLDVDMSALLSDLRWVYEEDLFTLSLQNASISSFDYVIVGAGEAGSILAYRLSETNAKILIIEEGGCPPFESVFAGYLTMLPHSSYDREMNIYNDSYSCQNIRPNAGVVTAGKMLGGTGALNHMVYDTPNKADYDSWGAAASDSSWAFPDFSYYFAKGENVKDEGVLAQHSSWHGTFGPTILKRQKSPLLTDAITAHTQIGSVYKDDTDGLCVTQPLLAIGDKLRQNGNVAYLSKMKERGNVYLLTGAIATKILFNGTKATGVQYEYSGSTYNVTAKTRVILSAGAIKSPQILMISGIGDSDSLNSLGIKPVVNNSHVGQNLMDRVGALFGIALNENTAVSAAVDPHEWPLPILTNTDALNKSQTQAERQDIIVYIGPNSTGLLQLCTNSFNYNEALCDKWYESNINRNTLFVLSTLMHPVSKGYLTLNTTNINDQPIIKLGLLSNTTDLDAFAQLMMQYVGPLINSAALQKFGAKFIDIGLCSEHTKFSFEFWKCYVLATSLTRWQYSGTCGLGKVVDASLNVIGTSNLNIVDASIIPHLTSTNIGSTVRALAEKAADIIKREDHLIWKKNYQLSEHKVEMDLQISSFIKKAGGWFKNIFAK